MAGLPPELDRQLQNELDPGENVLWSGQPDRGRMARQGTCPSLFGIPFTLFSLAWIGMATGIGSMFAGVRAGGAPIFPIGFSFFGLFGVPFLLVGIGLILSPLWLSLKAARTAYAVTSRRVLLLEGGWWRGTTVRTLGPAQVADRTRTQNADGSGDLIFNRLTTVHYDSDGDRTTRRVGFYGIPDVHGVDDLIRRTLENTRDTR